MSNQLVQSIKSPQEYTLEVEQEQLQNTEFIKKFKIPYPYDDKQQESHFGEIFITSNETNGGLEMLQFFKGKLISSLGGGQNKLFVIESSKEEEGVINSLHAPEYDEYDYTFTERDELEGKIHNPQQIIQAFNNKGSLKKIVSAKKHTMMLTNTGKVYSWGYGEYGALGLGGVIQSSLPKQLNNISHLIINQIACGESHAMVLTNQHDIYIWGRGFNGQLGMGKEITTLSLPKYVNFFHSPPQDETSILKLSKKTKILYKNYILQIACGTNHSLCINYQGKLYVWGENSLGQVGNNSSKNVFSPHQVQFPTLETITAASGGYGHSACLTSKGQIFTWGFNCYGQLGTGDSKSHRTPQLLTKDILTNQLPCFKKLSCGYNNTFAICNQGRLYSWGGGNLGQKDEKVQKAPRKIEAHTEGRIFTDVFSNNSSTLFFANSRIISIRPECGPSTGNTMLSLVGTGFSNTGKQKVRFNFSAKKLNIYKRLGQKNNLQKGQSNDESTKRIQVEVNCDFDPVTDCYHCFSPNFDEQCEELLEWPTECQIELSLDGSTYIQYQNKFLIYSSKLYSQNIYPKCASINGGTKLTLVIPNMDVKTATHLNNLTVGFQAKTRKRFQINTTNQSNNNNNNNEFSINTVSNKDNSNIDHNNLNTRPQSKSSKIGDKKGAINPLAVHPDDQELEKENWVCVVGNYENGKIVCQVPKIQDMNSDSYQFNVDIALNGQQFSGQPSSFRFYNIQVQKIEPSCGAYEGGLNIRVIGTGFFDTVNKQVMFKSQFGERIIDIDWDKNSKSYHFIQPPLNWLLADNQPAQETISQLLASPIQLFFSLNSVEWLNIGQFYYLEPNVLRIGHVDEKISQSQFEQQEVYSERTQDENNKLIEIDNYECQQLFKKPTSKLYIYGESFQNLDTLKARFKYKEITVETSVFYKNDKKLGVIVPEIDIVPQGYYDVEIEISLNGIQYSKQGNTFKFLAFDKNMNMDQRNKFEENELKNLKKKK